MEKDEKNNEELEDFQNVPKAPPCFTVKKITTLKETIKNEVSNATLEPSILPQWKVNNQRLLAVFDEYLAFSKENQSEEFFEIKHSYNSIQKFKRKWEEFSHEVSKGNKPYAEFEHLSPLWLRDPKILLYVDDDIRLNSLEAEFGVTIYYKYLSKRNFKISRDDELHDYKCYSVVMDYLYTAIEVVYNENKAVFSDNEYKEADLKVTKALANYHKYRTEEAFEEYEKACDAINSLELRLFEKYRSRFFEFDTNNIDKVDGFKPAYDLKVVEYRPGHFQLVHTPNNFRQTFVSHSPKERRTDKTQEEIEDDRKKYARRAADRIRSIGLSNIWTQFWTLTFDKTKVESRYDYEYLSKLVKRWLYNTNRRHERKYGKKFKYIAVSEFHKDKAIHFHLLVNDYEFPLGEEESRYNDNKKKLHKSHTLNEWEYGFSAAMEIEQDKKGENSKNVTLYVSKYMSKSLENNPVGFKKNKNMYWVSHGLNRPNNYYLDTRNLSNEFKELFSELEPVKFKNIDEDGQIEERDYLIKKVWEGAALNEDGELEDQFRDITTKIYNILFED